MERVLGERDPAVWIDSWQSLRLCSGSKFADADAVFEEPEVQICGESAELFQVLEGR